MIEHVRQLSAATDLPLSADLENCYAHDPREAAPTLLLAAGAGAVGGSIEDYSGDPAKPIYDFPHAVERLDVTKESEAANIVARAEDRFGRVDILVNNAAILDMTPLADLTM